MHFSFFTTDIPFTLGKYQHSAGTQLGGGGRVDRPPLLFFENRKKVPRFWKNKPNCASTSDESSIQNVVLRISKKASKFFPAEPFFFCF